MASNKYDIIGDIHGHADALIELLEKLGYSETETGYAHSERKVLFLGDFIDRGEQLAQHRKLLNIVMKMVRNGHAKAIMGNHEFNALAYHTHVNGQPLRPHIEKNTKQHQAFLNEYDNDPEARAEVLDFFYTLPMWLDLGDLRAVHACWDASLIERLEDKINGAYLTPELMEEATTKGTDLYLAVETLLKGVEVPLPNGVTFKDKSGHPRREVRVQWWNPAATSLGEIALPLGVDIGEAANLPVEQGIPYYPEHSAPCFIGHYWLKGTPAPQATNVACLDYSVAASEGERQLVAYRFNGEQTLSKDNYVSVRPT
ncbi:metallophosphoesterase [Microbulbifer bruguierae]|uniref:Metallophosphoesterase n=1 Tax=Microbulbifer bruguierae TaxID=3029061 RepID=A0ABY8NCF1_9GAMM|nr:metallophosphoesterase [Microbulbifer bruguierae]WGL16272.1 metallophosphoesterase [Microbulbifer bruguierae]